MKNFLLELFVLDGNQKPSHTKLFSVLGYFMLLILFPYVVLFGSSVSEEMWLIILLTLIGNRSVNKIVELKEKKFK